MLPVIHATNTSRFQIKVDNVALRLIEDRPPPNITSPGTPPIDVAVPTLLITRDKSGLFSIRAPGKPPPQGPRPSQTSQVNDRLTSSPLLLLLQDVGGGGSDNNGSESPSSSESRARNRLETELQQRASLLAADNANMRAAAESASAEVQALKKRIQGRVYLTTLLLPRFPKLRAACPPRYCSEATHLVLLPSEL